MNLTEQILRAAAGSFFGTVGFAMLVHVPKSAWFPSGVIAVLSYLVYWGLERLGVPDPMAIFCGSLFGSLAGLLCARRMKIIGTVFLMSAIIPVVNIGSRLGPILFMVGLAFSTADSNYTVSKIGLILFALTAVFSLITLPVEYDASNRAKAWLEDSGLLYGSELKGVESVLSAAALTYVSAAIQAIANVLYYASILGSRSSRNRR